MIITRPFEYHHCVYHSMDLHKHFWILFSPRGNEALLDMFFNRKSGEGNLLVLTPENSEALISLCNTMLEEAGDTYKSYVSFFKLLDLLASADRKGVNDCEYPDDIIAAINYINNNFAYNLSVSQIASAVNVSVNTLERHFMSALNMSPSVYVRKKRLANAIKLSLTSMWLPSMTADELSIKKAVKGWSFVDKKLRGGIFSTYLISIYMIMIVNVIGAISTIGSSLILTLPASYFFLICLQYVNYYTLTGKKYFLTHERIVTNELHGDESLAVEFIAQAAAEENKEESLEEGK